MTKYVDLIIWWIFTIFLIACAFQLLSYKEANAAVIERGDTVRCFGVFDYELVSTGVYLGRGLIRSAQSRALIDAWLVEFQDETKKVNSNNCLMIKTIDLTREIK